MTDKTTVKICNHLELENQDETPSPHEESLFPQEKLLPEIAVFEINGPFFYSVSHLLDDALTQLSATPKVFVLCMHRTPLVDSTGLKALKQFSVKCRQKNIAFLIGGAKPDLFKKSNVEGIVGKNHIFHSVNSALASAKNFL